MLISASVCLSIVMGCQRPLLSIINDLGGVLAEFGAKWKSEWWWVYDPITDKFFQNELTHQLRNLQAAAFRIDPKARDALATYGAAVHGNG